MRTIIALKNDCKTTFFLLKFTRRGSGNSRGARRGFSRASLVVRHGHFPSKSARSYDLTGNAKKYTLLQSTDKTILFGVETL